MFRKSFGKRYFFRSQTSPVSAHAQTFFILVTTVNFQHVRLAQQPRKLGLSTSRTQAQRVALNPRLGRFSTETPLERECRLQIQREQRRRRRQQEPAEQKEHRLAQRRQRRQQETEEQDT